MAIAKKLMILLMVLIFAFLKINILYSQNTMQKIWQVEGKNDGDELGAWVAGLGDINGDGFDDVAVCSHALGKTFIYFGAENMDTMPDLILRGGLAAAGKGDVNHDGYVEIMTSDSRNVYL